MREDKCAREVIGIIEQRRKRHTPDGREKHRGQNHSAGNAKHSVPGDRIHTKSGRGFHFRSVPGIELAWSKVLRGTPSSTGFRVCVRTRFCHHKLKDEFCST